MLQYYNPRKGICASGRGKERANCNVKGTAMTMLLLFSKGLCGASAKSQNSFPHKSRFFLSRNGCVTELEILGSHTSQVEDMLTSVYRARTEGWEVR